MPQVTPTDFDMPEYPFGSPNSSRVEVKVSCKISLAIVYLRRTIPSGLPRKKRGMVKGLISKTHRVQSSERRARVCQEFCLVVPKQFKPRNGLRTE